MRFLRWIIFYAVLLSVTGYIFYYFHPELPSQIKRVQTPYCSEPIGYKIGVIDPKYGVSEKQFALDIAQAAKIWNDVSGKELFAADPKAKLTISLVYDERQTLETQANKIEDKLKTQKQQLQPSEEKYKSMIADFKSKVAALNQEIEDWNYKGGAPEDVYNQLIQRQNQLKAESDQINAFAKQFNQSVNEYNSQVDSLKDTVSTLNQVFALKPEEGIYDPNENKITIFLNVGQKELVHTLAHELGHALGIQHNSNPKSIMYPSTTTLTTASPEDIVAMQNICNTTWQQRLKKVLSEYSYNI